MNWGFPLEGSHGDFNPINWLRYLWFLCYNPSNSGRSGTTSKILADDAMGMINHQKSWGRTVVFFSTSMIMVSYSTFTIYYIYFFELCFFVLLFDHSFFWWPPSHQSRQEFGMATPCSWWGHHCALDVVGWPFSSLKMLAFHQSKTKDRGIHIPFMKFFSFFNGGFCRAFKRFPWCCL